VKVRHLLSLVIAVFALSLGARELAAQTTDVIRGKVTGPDSLPIQGVTVTATSISGNVSRNAKTDKNGNFSIAFPNGDGDYIVAFASMGYAARRFQVKRTADQEFLVADARLARSAVTLDAMKVESARQRPDRNAAATFDLSGTERGLGGGVVGIDQMGDLAAMAGSLPGFSYIPAGADGPGGFSVFGLDAAQNLTTINGLPTGADGLPGGAAASTSISTSPYDVARGGFAGGSTNIRPRSGSNFVRRSATFAGMLPQATWTDATGRAAGAASTYGQFGMSLGGPIKFNKAYYATSFDISNTQSDLLSLLNQSPSSLTTAGVSTDSVNNSFFGQFAGTTNTLSGLPQTVGQVPNDNTLRSARLFSSFDFTPPSSTTGAAYNVSIIGNYSSRTPGFLNALDLPTRGAESSNWTIGVQGRHNSYFGFGVLTETNVGISTSGSSTDPFLAMPSGSVRVSSDLGGASPVVRNLGFGGAQSRSSGSSLSPSFLNTLSWFSRNNKHRIKMTTELNYAGRTDESFGNEYGTYTYQTLTDLANNTPSSYSRQLTPRKATTGNIIGGWSIGDSYRPNQDFQVQYGVRIDGNHFTTLPTRNAAVEAAFGVRNDKVPTPVYLSPRIGFTKTIGTAPEIVQFTGAFQAPRNVINGGVGVFQTWANTGPLATAIANNGLPSGIQQLSCVGPAATPIPDWSSLPTSIFDVCDNGVGASEFISTAPNVNLYSQDFVSPRSVRGNLNWRGYPFNGRFSSSINFDGSYNINQSSNFDLNFNPDVAGKFTLADEDNRPVYVKNTSIVPGSGLISSRDAKVSQNFNRVSELRSDLTSHSEAMTVTVSPYNWNYSWRWNLTYRLASTRDQVRGFGGGFSGGNTAGDPRETQWGRGNSDSRHEFRVGFNYNFFGTVRVNWQQSFRSGTPYTPMISGDVNGDGYNNDRAFIFDPATASDPGVQAGMQTLLASAPDNARECLKSQLGNLATRGSCQSPWISGAQVSLFLDPVKLHLPHRMGLSVGISNPLGAVDMLLHGESKMHGWGQSPAPDQTLLNVKGFDPATNRYTYEVNQRFGSTSIQNTLARQPVRIQMQAQFDLGPTTERQLLTQQLDRGRAGAMAKAPKMNEQMWKSQYSSGPVLNPLRQILAQADSMMLTRVQADSIASLNRWYTVRLDSVWTPIAKQFAEMPESYDQSEAYALYRQGREASVDLLMKVVPLVNNMLTSAQKRKLGFMAQYMDTRYLAYVRSGTASGGMGIGIPIGAEIMMMEGAVRMVIVR
jgi:hypothetical protein